MRQSSKAKPASQSSNERKQPDKVQIKKSKFNSNMENSKPKTYQTGQERGQTENRKQ